MPSSFDLQFHTAGWWFKGPVAVDATHVITHSTRYMCVCDLHDIIVVIISWSFNSCGSALNFHTCGYFSITGNVSVSLWEMAFRGNVSFKLLIGTHTHTAHFCIVFPVLWLGLLDSGRVRPSVIPFIYHQETSRRHARMQHAVIHSPSAAL